jgi:hypothetical protein
MLKRCIAKLYLRFFKKGAKKIKNKINGLVFLIDPKASSEQVDKPPLMDDVIKEISYLQLKLLKKSQACVNPLFLII